jgi:uncharacterized protein YlxW (UPF0749 family)
MALPQGSTLAGHPLPRGDTLALTFILGLLGLLVVITAAPRPPAPTAGQRTDTDLARSAQQRLEEEQKNLQAEVAALQADVALAQRLATARSSSLSDLARDLDRQRTAAGLTPLRGPGVRVVLDDSPRIPPGTADISSRLVQDYQIRDVSSVLWQLGAEAVAINDQRLVFQSAVAGVGNTMLVNGARVVPPYEIRAIGDGARLQAQLTSPGTLYELKTVVERQGLVFKVERQDNISIPAYRGPLVFRWARVAGP